MTSLACGEHCCVARGQQWVIDLQERVQQHLAHHSLTSKHVPVTQQHGTPYNLPEEHTCTGSTNL
jgi:hypothetical protein